MAAADEAGELAALGVLTPNTILIHGLAFDAAVRAQLIERNVGVVWCPGSNLYLFGRAASVGDMARAGLVALGTDSRLSGARDLLDELNVAHRTGEMDGPMLESLVTTHAARLLRLPERGVLRAGADADLIVLPRDAQLGEARRADLRCVIVQGRAMCGDCDLADPVLAPDMTAPVVIDGRAKFLAARIAEWLANSPVGEPGVEIDADAERAA